MRSLPLQCRATTRQHLEKGAQERFNWRVSKRLDGNMEERLMKTTVDRKICQKRPEARLVLLAALLSLLTLQSAHAAVTVDISFFHDRLAPYGNWIQHQRYGWVWQPTVVDVSWRPYTDGHWVMTEEYGWFWDSDQEWGWAPFHYGRWACDGEFGWVWVPGYEWGPAWVAWRNGAGYVGWAPLPPEVGWDPGTGLRLGGFNLDAGIYRPSWIFVEERHFLEPRLHQVFIEPARNITIIERTRNVTDYVTINHHIVNRGLPVQRIEQVTGRRVERFRVSEVVTVAATRAPRSAPNIVNIFRPDVRISSNRGLSTPPHAVDRIRANRQAILEEQHREEMERMARRHQKELEQAGIAPDALRQQHEAERQALREQHRREEHQLQNWALHEGTRRSSEHPGMGHRHS